MEQQRNQGQHQDVEFTAEDIESFLGGVLAHPFPTGQHATHAAAAPTQGGATAPEVAAEASDDARTERKRCRERQRRMDVNKQFSELTDAMRKIESESDDWKQQSHLSSTNRADIIARTVSLLNSLHEANEDRKRKVSTLEKDLDAAKKAGEETAAKLKEQMMAPQPMSGGKMMMMVPMMIGGESGPTPYGQMPQQFFMPANPAAAASAGSPESGAAANPMAAAPTAAGATPAGPQWGHMMPPTWGMAPGGWGMVAPMPPGPAVPPGDDKKKAPANASDNVPGSNLAHCA